MRGTLLGLFSTAFVFLLMIANAGAAMVTLDAVDNAGWYLEDLSKPYLRISDASGELWSSTTQTPAWNNFSELVEDLADGTSGIVAKGVYVVKSGGNIFEPSAPIFQTISLDAGVVYSISLASDSDAYNIRGYNDSNYGGGQEWNTYVQMWTSTEQALAFDLGTDTHVSAVEAINAGAALDPLFLHFDSDTDLYLYINDINSLDNIGSVTLDIRAVPLPAAWILFGSGIAFFFGSRRKRTTSQIPS